MYTKKVIISIALLCAASTQTNFIKLESDILEKVDGLSIGITGEAIAMMKQYQARIIDILIGEKTATGRAGIYEFQGKKYTMQELRQLESNIPASVSHMLRAKIRADFERVSEPFRKTIQGVKPIMTILIEESSIKRNRLDSLLYVWAKTDVKNEYELFDIHIKSIKDFETFLIDLNNFLGDLVHSCPRACAQFKEHVDKFNLVKQFTIELKISQNRHKDFLKHINTLLPTIAKHEITKHKVEELYKQFAVAPAA